MSDNKRKHKPRKKGKRNKTETKTKQTETNKKPNTSRKKTPAELFYISDSRYHYFVHKNAFEYTNVDACSSFINFLFFSFNPVSKLDTNL